MVTVETISEEAHLTRAAAGIYGESLLCLDLTDSHIGKAAPSTFEAIGVLEAFIVEPVPIQTQTSRSMMLLDQQKDGWISYIREVIYAVAEIEKVYVEIADKQVDVWVIIPKRDIAVVRQIVERQGEIVRAFASVEDPPFLLDFHVVYRNGRDESLFVPELAIRLSKTL